MKPFKFKCLLFLLCFMCISTLKTFAQNSVSCKETTGEVGNGSTFFLRDEKKLKVITGNATFPDGSPANVKIVIYKNIFRKNKDIDYKEVVEIDNEDNKIITCKSDDEGRFEIKGLKNGFYLLKIGTNSGSGFGPEFVLIQISRKNGKSKKIMIDLGSAI